MPVDVICGSCGKTFLVPPRFFGVTRFCSQACKFQGNRIERECTCCGKRFWIWKSREAKQHGNGKFCSKACMVRAKRSTATPIPKHAFQSLLKVCEVCGSTFRIPPSRQTTARWCSRRCQKLSPTFKAECSEKQQAEKSWRWSGGKYKTHQGYVRLKRKRRGKETVRQEHTDVMIRWMLKAAPKHPFLIVIDGWDRLHPDIEVHHIDRNRSNNVHENLLAVTKDAHARIHHRGKKPEPWECWPSNPQKW